MAIVSLLSTISYIPYGVSLAASNFAKLPLLPAIYTAYNGVEAYITHRQNQDLKYFERIEKKKFVLLSLNLVSAFWSYGKLLDALGGRFSLFQFSRSWSLLQVYSFAALSFGAAAAWVLTASAIVSLVQKRFEKREDPKEILQEQYPSIKDFNDTEIKWGGLPLAQFLEELLYVTRIALNVGILIASPSRFLFAINVPLLGYSIYQLAQRKWLQFTRTFEKEVFIENVKTTVKAKLVYVRLIFPLNSEETESKKSEECSICLEVDVNPDTYFCASHVFHIGCIIKHIYSKSGSMIKDSRFTPMRDLNENLTWKVELTKDSSPSCPGCRGVPLKNDVEVHIYDKKTGKYRIYFPYFVETTSTSTTY